MLTATAQKPDQFELMPGYTATLAPGQKLQLAIQWIDSKGASHLAGLDPLWTVNGHDIGSLNPSNGSFSVSLTMSEATYTAPLVKPEKNPVIINVRFHTNAGEKQVIILQCAVTIEQTYKLSGDVMLTSALTGTHIKLHIEDHVRYAGLVDGSFILEPVNGKGTVHAKVVEGIMLNKNGATGTYKSPEEYELPILISIKKTDKNGGGPATFYIKSFSAPDHKETYLIEANGASRVVQQDFINHTIATVFVSDIGNSQEENIDNGLATLDWASRNQSLQGKAHDSNAAANDKDIKQLQALQQKLGYDNNPFSQVPIDKDGHKVENNRSNDAATLAQRSPATVFGGAGEMNIHTSFNPQNKRVLEINKEGESLGGTNHATIHIVVEKP